MRPIFTRPRIPCLEFSRSGGHGLTLKAALLVLVTIALGIAQPCAAKTRRTPWSAIALHAPHRLERPRAKLSAHLKIHTDTRARRYKHDLHSARSLALSITTEVLRFGLGHRTNMAFDVRVRSGNCVEYAHLFAALFNRLAKRFRVPARAWVVRSAAPRIFGLRVPHPAFRSHHWVVIKTGRRSKWLYVDPSLADVGLSWEVRSRVRGRLP